MPFGARRRLLRFGDAVVNSGVTRVRGCRLRIANRPDTSLTRRKSPRRDATKMASNLETLVTVFGGSGFLGRNVVRALCKRDYRVRVAVRRPELAGFLQPSGMVGQVHTVQANLRYPASVEAALRDSHVVINLVGILAQSGGQTFDAVQAKGAETVARAAATAGARPAHVSAIGPDAPAAPHYAPGQAAGEKAGEKPLPPARSLPPPPSFR